MLIRSAWNRKNHYDCGSCVFVGQIKSTNLDSRSFKRRRQKHRREAVQAKHQLRDHRVKGVPFRVVREFNFLRIFAELGIIAGMNISMKLSTNV